VRTLLFAGGYLGAWGVFSFAATALQLGLTHVGLIDDMGAAKRSA
jgi:predicted metal-binding membrane protein